MYLSLIQFEFIIIVILGYILLRKMTDTKADDGVAIEKQENSSEEVDSTNEESEEVEELPEMTNNEFKNLISNINDEQTLKSAKRLKDVLDLVLNMDRIVIPFNDILNENEKLKKENVELKLKNDVLGRQILKAEIQVDTLNNVIRRSTYKGKKKNSRVKKKNKDRKDHKKKLKSESEEDANNKKKKIRKKKKRPKTPEVVDDEEDDDEEDDDDILDSEESDESD